MHTRATRTKASGPLSEQGSKTSEELRFHEAMSSGKALETRELAKRKTVCGEVQSMFVSPSNWGEGFWGDR